MNKKKVGTCDRCYIVSWVADSKGWWQNNLCEECIAEKMNIHG